MSLTCLSRTLDPTDFVQLRDELQRLDENRPDSTASQRWEAALALHAKDRWRAAGHTERHWYSVTVGTNLDEFCVGGTALADVIIALSVLERVPNPEQFLYQLACLLAPGGLLVLTFAFWNRCGPDTAVGHQLRQRIYCPKLTTQLRAEAQALQLTPFGGVDPTWHGATVHDYTMASLVLEKRR